MRPRHKWVIGIGLAGLLGGCNGLFGSSPGPATHAATPGQVTMAIMPIEGDLFPKLVKTVNGAFLEARVGGVQKSFVSKVSLEVVQISIECVDLNATCWSAAGKSIYADRLLFAQIDPIPSRKKPGVRLRVTLFDVKRGDVIGEAFRAFATEDEAVSATKSVVDEALSAATPPPEVHEAPAP